MRPSRRVTLWEFRRSAAPLFVPLDFGGYRTGALLAAIPWRGVGWGVLAAAGLVLFKRVFLPGADEGLVLSVAFAVVVLLGGVEAINRRDVLTPTCLVRQYGLFGTLRVEFPLRTILRVEFSHPRWGKSWGVGDIYIYTDTGSTVITGVSDAALGAQRILDAKAALAR